MEKFRNYFWERWKVPQQQPDQGIQVSQRQNWNTDHEQIFFFLQFNEDSLSWDSCTSTQEQIDLRRYLNSQPSQSDQVGSSMNNNIRPSIEYCSEPQSSHLISLPRLDNSAASTSDKTLPKCCFASIRLSPLIISINSLTFATPFLLSVNKRWPLTVLSMNRKDL